MAITGTGTWNLRSTICMLLLLSYSFCMVLIVLINNWIFITLCHNLSVQRKPPKNVEVIVYLRSKVFLTTSSQKNCRSVQLILEMAVNSLNTCRPSSSTNQARLPRLFPLQVHTVDCKNTNESTCTATMIFVLSIMYCIVPHASQLNKKKTENELKSVQIELWGCDIAGQRWLLWSFFFEMFMN